MNELGVKIRWVGREKKLWSGVLKELKEAQELTKNNKILTLNMCVNYGGRAEMLDAAVAIAKDAMKKKIKPDSLSEKSINKYIYAPAIRGVDLWGKREWQGAGGACHPSLLAADAGAFC